MRSSYDYLHYLCHERYGSRVFLFDTSYPQVLLMSFPQWIFALFDFCFLLYVFIVSPALAPKCKNLTFALLCILYMFF